MAKKDYYIVSKNVEKLIKGDYTNFLDPLILRKVISKLKNIKYNIYSPICESDKKIIYIKNIPKVRLLEIISYDNLLHSDIMGSLFNMKIDPELFGDIIIYNNHYYVIIMDRVYKMLRTDFNMVGNHSVRVEERPLELLEDFERKYQAIDFVVSSCRLDNIVCKLIGTSRDSMKKLFVSDSVILNYEVCHKANHILNKDDIFSIRKYGKYRFDGIVKKTKKNNYIVKCSKYIDS